MIRIIIGILSMSTCCNVVTEGFGISSSDFQFVQRHNSLISRIPRIHNLIKYDNKNNKNNNNQHHIIRIYRFCSAEKKWNRLLGVLSAGNTEGELLASSKKETTTTTTKDPIPVMTRGSSDTRVVTVALTRELGKNGKLRKVLNTKYDKDRENGNEFVVRTVELPCIEHAVGPDYPRLSEMIGSGQFDYIVVTSPEAARVVASVWSSCTPKKTLAVAAVGTATEQALHEAGIAVDFVPSKANADTLGKELPHRTTTSTANEGDLNNDLALCRVLYPASARADVTLQNGLHDRRHLSNAMDETNARIFEVTRLNTYDTIPATDWTIEQKQASKSVDVVTFASPSSIKGWLVNTNNNTSVLAACIGETSAMACINKYGWIASSLSSQNSTNHDNIIQTQASTTRTVFFPEKPGIEGWVTAIDDAIHQVLLSQQQQ